MTSRRIRAVVAVSAIAASCAAGMPAALAGVVTLTDLNTTMQFDTQSQAGLSDWIVDGVDQIERQWFWYRLGNTAEQSIDTLNLVGTFSTDTNPFTDVGNDTLSILYRDAAGRFEIELAYQLRGGNAGSSASDLGELITIRNLTGSSLSLSFFQYADFNLNGTAGGDTVEFLNGNHVRHSSNGSAVNETIVLPLSTHFEANVTPVTLASLNDGAATTLNDTAGPVGPGDVSWAFQWDFVINGNRSVIISKDKSITPEPTTMALVGCGVLLASRRRRHAA